MRSCPSLACANGSATGHTRSRAKAGCWTCGGTWAMKCALGVLLNRLENDLTETRTGRVDFARTSREQGALPADRADVGKQQAVMGHCQLCGAIALYL